MTATPCRAVHWSRGPLFWNDKQVKHFEKMQILAFEAFDFRGEEDKTHSYKVISKWCHHPNRVKEEKKHHSSPKVKPEIEKTIRHVEARLTTGVNTRGCVKLPLRASRSLIWKEKKRKKCSNCLLFEHVWFLYLDCLMGPWQKVFVTLRTLLRKMIRASASTRGRLWALLTWFYLHSSLCCHKIFASSVCCWWLLAWLSLPLHPPHTHTPLQHSPGISFS